MDASIKDWLAILAADFEIGFTFPTSLGIPKRLALDGRLLSWCNRHLILHAQINQLASRGIDYCKNRIFAVGQRSSVGDRITNRRKFFLPFLTMQPQGEVASFGMLLKNVFTLHILTSHTAPRLDG